MKGFKKGKKKKKKKKCTAGIAAARRCAPCSRFMGSLRRDGMLIFGQRFDEAISNHIVRSNIGQINLPASDCFPRNMKSDINMLCARGGV